MQAAFIQCDADIMGGTPVFADSRVPVRTRDKVLAFLEAAGRHTSLLAGF